MKNIINTQNVTEGIKLVGIFTLVSAPVFFDAWNATFIGIAAVFSYIGASGAQGFDAGLKISLLKKSERGVGITIETLESGEKIVKENQRTQYPTSKQTMKRSFIPLNGFRKSLV